MAGTKKQRANTDKEEEPEEFKPFRFRRFMGLEPRSYILAIYIILFLLLFSVLFLFPGLSSPTAKLELRVYPSDAQVYINDQILEADNYKFIIPAGKQRIRLHRAYFNDLEWEQDFPKKVFNNRFGKPSIKLSKYLSIDKTQLRAYLHSVFIEYNQRGLEGQNQAAFDSSYPYPPIMQEAIRNIFYSQSKQDLAALSAKELDLLFLKAFANSSSMYQVADLISGLSIGKSSGGLLSPGAILRSGMLASSAISVALQEASWISDFLAPRYSRELFDWRDKVNKSLGSPTKTAKKDSGGQLPPTMSLNGAQFILLPGENFLIQETEVTNRQFAEFIRQNPEFRPSVYQQTLNRYYNNESLLLEKPGDYLASWLGAPVPPSRLEDLPVRSVDWYAASAYTKWLTTQLEPNYMARLPYASEWELAAFANEPQLRPSHDAGLSLEPLSVYDLEAGSLGLRGLIGNVWEWSFNDFYYYDKLASWADSYTGAATDLVRSNVAELRGGSWLNYDYREEGSFSGADMLDIPEAVSISDRGAQPKEMPSPYLGFRPVVVLR